MKRFDREVDYLQSFPFRDSTSYLKGYFYLAESAADRGVFILVDKFGWKGWSLCWIDRENQGEPMPSRTIWPIPGRLALWLARKLSAGPDIGSGVKHTVRKRQWAADDRLWDEQMAAGRDRS